MHQGRIRTLHWRIFRTSYLKQRSSLNLKKSRASPRNAAWPFSSLNPCFTNKRIHRSRSNSPTKQSRRYRTI
ncbi:unnamed protein product [Blepharisma stoltei]|uniref:Uncharacterized protein n=1 Tax=Blepharisma stoltei TaxID=1481888 RepID=A0AAU9JCE7_9CILI|nr:unnamed protein product [Blepharisma stoltei]